MKLVKAAELASEAYLRLCAYGEPGTGKTWLGASAALDPLTSPVLFCDFRSQVSSLRSNPEFLEAMEDGRLVVVSLKNYEELNHVYTYLFTGEHKNLKPLFTRDIWEGHRMPKTLVVDSATELQRAEVLRLGGNTPGKFVTEVQPPEIREWGTLLNQFMMLARLFYELPMHVVFNGLEAVDYGKHAVGVAAPITGYRLAMQGKAQRQFPAYALTVMRLERAPRGSKMKSGGPVFTIGYTQAVRAKTKEQTGLIPAQIPNPTIPMLARYLRGPVKEG